MDVFVNLEGLVKEVHSAVARGDHELPFDLSGLDLEGTLEVHDSLLELVLLGVMHAEARYNIDLCRVVAVRLLIVMNCLELILLLLIQIAHLGEDFRVAGYLGYQDVVPLEGLSTHAD